MYSPGVTSQNYLRGVQATDGDGVARFVSVYPGCYPGRMPHVHFEIYRSLAAIGAAGRLKTSQLALPVAESQAVYAGSAYAGSTASLGAISFASDGVFSDGVSLQLASLTGSAAAGYVASLQVGIAA